MRFKLLVTTQSGNIANQQDASRSLGMLVRQESQTLLRLRDDMAKAGRWKKCALFIAFARLVRALGLGIALPCFIASNDTSCAVLGGEVERAVWVCVIWC
ncbi:MAG: hypothetical protein HC844_10830 [Tabrizicola sp.]|nr:hypothetical protein [Tabrizicola sp.]